MHVVDEAAAQLRDREVVGADEADGVGCEQGVHDALGSDEAIAGVRSLKQLVEEKEERWPLRCKIANVAKTRDFGVKA